MCVAMRYIQRNVCSCLRGKVEVTLGYDPLAAIFQRTRTGEERRKSGFLSSGARWCNHVYTTVYVRR